MRRRVCAALWVAATAAAFIGTTAWGQAVIREDPIPIPQPTPGWETKVSNPNDPNYYKPDYPIVFVRSPVVERTQQVCYKGNGSCTTDPDDCGPGEQMFPGILGDYHTGADVVTASNPSVGNQLWIYLPTTGKVKKLFPRLYHEDPIENPNLIDFSRTDGSVVEPSLSEDGTRIYFAYFQDATDANGTNSEQISRSGADLYAMDIGPLLADPNHPINSLGVTRLTYPLGRNYISGGIQDPIERDEEAMNQVVAGNTTGINYDFGTIYMHPTEVRTRNGLYLAYVSNKRRLHNSNEYIRRSNHNFNLHFAPILPDGTLGEEDNQFGYFTTTSALSPTPLREGLAFSYQATTEDGRFWHVQKLDSEGRWNSLTGFGSGDQLFHLGSFCVAEESGVYEDYFVSLKYYNLNNESFGSIWKQDLSILGKNTYNNPVNGGTWKVPRQAGALELTELPSAAPHTLSQDKPSPKNGADEYYGKFSTPRCGGVDELFFAHTPTSANSNLFDEECNKGVYHSYIGFRNDLEQWLPGEPASQNGHFTVIRRSNDDSNLLWPVPIVPWSVRSNGDVTQRFTGLQATQKTPHIVPGEPFAHVGTSDMANTDRRPPECYITQSGGLNYYHPHGVFNINQENDQIMFNQDTWTQVPEPVGSTNFCQAPSASNILGIAINLVSNNPNLQDTQGYKTGLKGKPKESARLLGIYDVTGGNDRSFIAQIPANVPFEFHALDTEYGMRLTDVRSWHSLKPRESRTDCGGCHQHDLNGPYVPFAGTDASQEDPLDMVRSTPSISYDPFCNVQADPPDTAASEPYPEWEQDILPGLNQYCVSCHHPTQGNQSGLAAFSLGETSKFLYDDLFQRGFVDPRRGALSSQLFMAVVGARTDNRDNTDPQLAADYDCELQSQTNPSGCSKKEKWGFYYSSAHDDLPTGCEDGDQAYADWAFKVGKWIDNHAPRNTGAAYPYDADRYHPTADTALTTPTCAATSMRVGWWDESGQVASVQVRHGQNVLYSNGGAGNGSATFSLPANLTSSDVIAVVVRDVAHNRQIYHKTVGQLIDECNLPDPFPGGPTQTGGL